MSFDDDVPLRTEGQLIDELRHTRPIHGGYPDMHRDTNPNRLTLENGDGKITDVAIWDARQLSDEELAAQLLESTTGLDPDSEHGEGTPKRFAAMLRDMTTREEFQFTTFENSEGSNEMITITDIPFYTFCNHHVVPFFGYAHIAYIPQARIAGLSKFGRTVKNLAKGLWVQENLTTEIADFLVDKLEPLGVAVVLQAEHMCMTMRGVQMPGTKTITSAMRGVFEDHDRTAKAEFMSLIQGRL